MLLFLIIGITLCQTAHSQTVDPIQEKTTAYFNNLFGILKKGAEKNPDKDNFREVMQPLVKDIDGMYGATLIGTNWVIKQVYFSSHFLARGFDLKKVDELKDFYKEMQVKPAPQLSEPGHGSIMQPALIAMRYPVIKDGEFVNIVSMMVRTEKYLEAVGLDKVKAYEIVCRGKSAEKEGDLSSNPKVITLELPSTTWVIKYDD